MRVLRCLALRRVLIVVAPLVCVACTRESPLSPNMTAAALGQTPLNARGGSGATGIYEIGFLKETSQGPQPVINYTLNVGENLALSSTITNSLGGAVESGTVTYEYCTRGNDPVPSSECGTKRGKWARLLSMPIDSVGNLAFFGTCHTPRVIGFRVRYTGQASGVASGASLPQDITWQ